MTSGSVAASADSALPLPLPLSLPAVPALRAMGVDEKMSKQKNEREEEKTTKKGFFYIGGDARLSITTNRAAIGSIFT